MWAREGGEGEGWSADQFLSQCVPLSPPWLRKEVGEGWSADRFFSRDPLSPPWLKREGRGGMGVAVHTAVTLLFPPSKEGGGIEGVR